MASHDVALMRLAFSLLLSGTAALASAWPASDARADTTLQPFTASYEAWYEGRRAGTATMHVEHDGDARWRVDLGIRGNRGVAGIVRLNAEQSTVFDEAGGHYRPLSQATVRRAALFQRRITGRFDWHARQAQWSGDLREERRKPVPLQDGDMTALLINLAVMRDAAPGRSLHYRFVDNGRARDHDYYVADQTENVTVSELSYEAMRVERTNGGNDETILWVADGVPTPVRILQREDGEDAIDLRLIEYQGVP